MHHLDLREADDRSRALAAVTLRPARSEPWRGLSHSETRASVSGQPLATPHELAFKVTNAVGAMSSVNADAHANSFARIFLRLGMTGATQEIIDLLGRSA